MKTFAIIGAGAIGGYYGACLQRAGYDVNYLFRRDYEYMQQHGWQIKSYAGDFNIEHVNAFNSIESMPKADAIILALNNLPDIAFFKELKKLLKPETPILIMQDGVGIKEALAEIFGLDRLIATPVYTKIYRPAPGVIEHTDLKTIGLGDMQVQTELSERIKTLTAIFEKAGFEVLVDRNGNSVRWRKFILSVCHASIGMTAGITSNGVWRDYYSNELAKLVMAELIALATADGAEIEADYYEQMVKLVGAATEHKGRIQIDFEKGHKVDLESYFGNPVELGKKLNVPMPHLETLYLLLKTRQERTDYEKMKEADEHEK